VYGEKCLGFEMCGFSSVYGEKCVVLKMCKI